MKYPEPVNFSISPLLIDDLSSSRTARFTLLTSMLMAYPKMNIMMIGGPNTTPLILRSRSTWANSFFIMLISTLGSDKLSSWHPPFLFIRETHPEFFNAQGKKDDAEYKQKHDLRQST